MKFFLSKAFVLLLVFALVQLPVHWVDDITNERMSFKSDAIQSVSRSYAGHQYVAGPVLVFPYKHTYWVDLHNDAGNFTGREERAQTGSISILPKTLVMDNAVTVEERKVGIFPVPVFKAVIKIKADFDWSDVPNPVALKADDTLEWGAPELALPIADQHGIKSIDAITWNQEKISYAPGTKARLFSEQGISASVNAKPVAGKGLAEIQLTLIGTEQLHTLPTADQASVSFTSNWPHPQFIGAQLPDTREVTSQGFTANWQSTALATNIHALWKDCYTNSASNNACNALVQESVGAVMIDPTNFYTKMSRALKYGCLFLTITFMAFVLFEVLCNLRIHPVQYALLGVASGIFFLLLLSMAEHIGFALAYGTAASACLLLLSSYAHALLKHWQRTASFSAVLAVLYGVLFVILQEEDAALLTGSILLFGLLSVAMMITRNIDWYAWQEKFGKPAEVVNP